MSTTDYDYFTTMYGGDIIDLFTDMKKNTIDNGIQIFSNNTYGCDLESFIYDNVIFKNPFRQPKDKEHKPYDETDIIIK